MGAGQATGRKGPCCTWDAAVPPLLGSREDRSTPILAFPSPPTQGHYTTGLEELKEFIWVVQRGLEVSLLYTNTQIHTFRATLLEVGIICFGSPDLRVRLGSQEPEEA